VKQNQLGGTRLAGLSIEDVEALDLDVVESHDMAPFLMAPG
jgi:hypothetical protein